MEVKMDQRLQDRGNEWKFWRREGEERRTSRDWEYLPSHVCISLIGACTEIYWGLGSGVPRPALHTSTALLRMLLSICYHGLSIVLLLFPNSTRDLWIECCAECDGSNN